MEWWVFPLLFVGAIGAMMWRSYKRAKEIHELKVHGLKAPGTIVAKRRFNTRSGGRWVLLYEYNVDGKVRKHRSHVSREEFDSFTEGQLIELRYLPHQPSVVAPEIVIQKAKQATGS